MVPSDLNRPHDDGTIHGCLPSEIAGTSCYYAPLPVVTVQHAGVGMALADCSFSDKQKILGEDVSSQFKSWPGL